MPTALKKELFLYNGECYNQNLQLCFLHGLFPKELSYFKVNFSFKSIQRKLSENYGPISAFPSLTKIIEGVVYLHLMHNLETNSMLSAVHYSFRDNLSTELICVGVFDNIH